MFTESLTLSHSTFYQALLKYKSNNYIQTFRIKKKNNNNTGLNKTQK